MKTKLVQVIFILLACSFVFSACKNSETGPVDSPDSELDGDDKMIDPDPTLLSIEISPTQFEIPEKQTVQLSLIGLYSDREKRTLMSEIKWYSINDAVASVDSNGLLTANKEGVTDIYASYNQLSVNTPITVTPYAGDTMDLKLNFENSFVDVHFYDLDSFHGKEEASAARIQAARKNRSELWVDGFAWPWSESGTLIHTQVVSQPEEGVLNLYLMFYGNTVGVYPSTEITALLVAAQSHHLYTDYDDINRPNIIEIDQYEQDIGYVAGKFALSLCRVKYLNSRREHQTEVSVCQGAGRSITINGRFSVQDSALIGLD